MLDYLYDNGTPSVAIYNQIVENVNSMFTVKSIVKKVCAVALLTLFWTAIAFAVGAPITATAIVVSTLVGAGIIADMGIDLLMKDELLSLSKGTFIKSLFSMVRLSMSIFLMVSIGTISYGWGLIIFYPAMAMHIISIESTDNHLAAAERSREQELLV